MQIVRSLYLSFCYVTKFFKWTGLVLEILLGGGIAFSQDNFNFETMFIDDGLSNNSINSILQTHDGFLWIATKDGLNRYDGQGFKVFKNNSFDTTSLHENYIMSLMETTDQELWVGTWGGGLCRYDRINEKFISYRVPQTKDDYIQCLYEDHNKNIWFGTTEGGLFMLSHETGKALNYTTRDLEKPFPADNITWIIEDHEQHFWIGTWNDGLIFFDPLTDTYKQYLHEHGNSNTISNNGVWHITVEKDNKLLLSTFRGLDRFDPASGKINHQHEIGEEFQELLSTTIRQTYRDKKERLWIGSYDYFGLFLATKNENGQIMNHRFVYEVDNEHSISINRIRCIYEDMKGNIWIGTENGLNKLPVNQPFKQYRDRPQRPYSLGGSVVSSICQGRENIIWVGFGGGGFDKIDLESGAVSHFKKIPGSNNTLSDNDIIYIYRTNDGLLWICTMSGGLNRFDPASGNFKNYLHYPESEGSIRSNWVLQVLETSDSLLLIGTNSGLDILDRETDTFRPFKPDMSSENIQLPANISVNALFEDTNHKIWIGTWLDGVFCYDPLLKTMVQYINNVNDSNSINCNKITTIHEDLNGIWFGTHSGGLNRFNAETGIFRHYTTLDGLPNDVVFAILTDSRSNLWISTMKGLVRLNPETGAIRIYDHLDGLISNQFNWRASHIDKNGVMYFGGMNGFVSFHPDSIYIDTVPPLIVITSFKVFNRKTAQQQALPGSKEVILKHNQNFFSIEFTALDMAPNQKHKYAYMLEGIDPDWVYSGTRTTAFYTDLHHGAFRFLTKACNIDDIWSEPVELSIKILPAWWNTIWVKIFGLLAIFGIGILVTRLRFWHLLEIERIRLNIASDLHDEMGSNLSSISVDSQQLMRFSKDNSERFELASDIYVTTNETIDSIRDIIWFINPKNDGGENMLFKMREKAAVLFAGMKWTFKIAEEIRFDGIKLATRRNIFLIYKETLTNIIRHANATECNIGFEKQLNAIIMTICDNGSGFEPTERKNQGGLTNIYHRAKKIGATVHLSSKPGKGTCLILELPLKSKSKINLIKKIASKPFKKWSLYTSNPYEK